MKSHDERMHELLYDCEGIVEKSERICKLEELVQEAYRLADFFCDQWDCGHCLEVGNICAIMRIKKKMHELGIKVQS